MKGFAIDNNGDLLIENNSIQMVDGKELLRQKIQEVLGTNKGEWFFDWEQGIDFSNVLGKDVTEESIRTEIENGLQQVDDSLVISEFSITKDESNRKWTVKFKATDVNTDDSVDILKEY